MLSENLFPDVDREMSIEHDTDFPDISASPTKIDTIIISDIHLGSDVARSKELLDVLRQYSFRRLILNGDIFDDLNFKRLQKNDWRFLSYIRRLANPKKNCEVIWIVGNHDGVAEILSHLLGVSVVEEYAWEQNGKKFLAIHGHQFDNFITERIVLTNIASAVYLFIQKMDGSQQRISRWVKQKSKTLLRISQKIAGEATEYAASKGADTVFCGHTHITTHIQTGNVSYYNSGCWTDKPSHYITIDTLGEVLLRECP